MAPSTSVTTSSHERTRQELARLQGVWTTIAGQRHTLLLIAGNLFTVKFEDGTVYMGKFELDPDESPQAMDMLTYEGPLKHKGVLTLCIYELTNDLLRWCPGKPGSGWRPSAFPSHEDPDALCLLFQREAARPRLT